jgi:PIN domain nuclease of toxin-antitoxin system
MSHMRLLLDTHAFIAWDDDVLPKAVSRAVQEADEVFVSSASAWEIAIKSGTGKLARRKSVTKALSDYDFLELTIQIRHAEQVRTLPLIHRDPFDRILIAQAQCEGLTLVSKDTIVRKYAVATLWD